MGDGGSEMCKTAAMGPSEWSVPLGAVIRLRRGERLEAIKFTRGYTNLPLEQCRELVDHHVRERLENYPPRAWPTREREAFTPAPWLCEANRFSVLREMLGEIGDCWGWPITKVDGKDVCQGCADYLATFAAMHRLGDDDTEGDDADA